MIVLNLVAMESTGEFHDKIIPYPKRRHDMDVNQCADLLYDKRDGSTQMEIENELDEAEDCDIDHEEDTIVLKELMTRVSRMSKTGDCDVRES